MLVAALSSIAVSVPASPAAADTIVPGVGVYGTVYIGETSRTQYFPVWWAPCGREAYLWEFRVDWNFAVTGTGVTVNSLGIQTTNWSPMLMAYVQKYISGQNQTYNISPYTEVLNGVYDGGVDFAEYQVGSRTFTWFDAPYSNVYFRLRVQVECPNGSPADVDNLTMVFELQRAKYWVDTFAVANGYSSPYSTVSTGTLNSGTSYVYCKAWGRQIGSGGAYNHWWMLTDLDTGSQWTNKYVSAYYLSRWGNDQAKDNYGNVIPTC